MEWISFLTGAMGTAFAFALFSNNDDAEIETEFETDDSELEVNDFSVRHVTLSCQTCRKLKRHKEIEANLYQCTKCKRHVDLRAS
ncbi:hypothetical protein [Peribacillus loiseleuriae]|uniref:Uncharacterized protein n=1 Tax=Peribacillus loiseleuriae TaxID=1679170 RepID=A0A0K9GSG7_9BACI|nr:hypothetical protein [Peribacillus loiseleuriae]KMY49583.1 hypothetical protein AC625_08530 [Peribacillus loiseleuriae]